MSPRILSTNGYEFRAKTQPALLRKIADFMAKDASRSFLLSVQLDLREEDLDTPMPYTAIAFIDGPQPRST